MQQELSKTVIVRDGGVDRRISMQDAIIRSLVHDAARGAAHARRQLIAMLQQFPPDSPSTTLADGALQPDEQAIIESYNAKLTDAAPTNQAEKPESGESEELGTDSEQEIDK